LKNILGYLLKLIYSSDNIIDNFKLFDVKIEKDVNKNILVVYKDIIVYNATDNLFKGIYEY
jgi:hypothetical protein